MMVFGAPECCGFVCYHFLPLDYHQPMANQTQYHHYQPHFLIFLDPRLDIDFSFQATPFLKLFLLVFDYFLSQFEMGE